MKKNILKAHPGLLDKSRQEVLKKLKSLTSDFVLGGGTALALQIAHRKSFDFDFFSSSQIPKKLLEKLSKVLPIENIAVDTSDELTVFTTDEIKITFLYYPFKKMFRYVLIEDELQIFSVRGIALQKAYAIGRRGEYRDYFDLFTILMNNHTRLKEIINQAKSVYNGSFDEKLFLEQLVYYKDLRSFKIIPVSIAQVPKPEEIKEYFERLVRVYASSLI